MLVFRKILRTYCTKLMPPPPTPTEVVNMDILYTASLSHTVEAASYNGRATTLIFINLFTPTIEVKTY